MNIKYLFLVFLFILSSCKSKFFNSNIDTNVDLGRNEFKYNLVKDKKEEDKKLKRIEDINTIGTIPSISKLLVAPPPPPIGNGELISFSVTEDVPLKDVLIELGRVADLDIEVDPQIDGGIILKVKQKPIQTVIERICELGGLRYSYTNNILRFEKDTPYRINYNVDFSIDGDMWGTIESSIQEILSANKDTDAKINVNKQASLITVFANSKSQRAVSAYIDEVKKNYSAQVLIEAKVVEVTLNEAYKTGINWSFLDGGNTSSGQIDFGTADSVVAGGITFNQIAKVFGGNLDATVSALETFGTTRTLSSPRVHAINNQKAELAFTNAIIYFELEKEDEETTTSAGEKTKTTYTSTKQEESEGVTLTITPNINLQTQEILLDVVPELKVRTGWVVDPADDTGKNQVPIIQTRKMETTLKIKSGGAMVIGGLMTERSTNTDSGIPLLSRIPILGYLFKSTSRENETVETVIFIKATIVNSSGNIDPIDRNFYDKYTIEKRKL